MDAELITTLCIVVLAGITGIVQICAFYRFFSLRSLMVIRKRYPKLILTEALAVIIYLLITLPFYYNSKSEYIDFGSNSSQIYLWGSRSIAFLCLCPMVFLITGLEISRLWLISYNLHYLNSSKNEKWKSQIDTNIANNDWYIRNKNTFGNQKKVIIAAISWSVLVGIIVDVGYYLNYDIGNLINSIFLLLAMCIAFYIFYQCRTYKNLQDNLLFYYELRVTVSIWGIGLILFVITAILEFAAASKKGMLTITDNLYGYNAMLTICLPSILSTLWIPHKLITSHKNRRQALVRHIEMSVTASVSEETLDDTKLFETLKNEQQFELLIQFMFRDFSSEAILGYIEMVQFKWRFVKVMDYKEDIDCIYMNSLYENAPKSSIVYDDKSEYKGIEKMKKVAGLLCDKYIRAGSEYEVNIAWKLRKKLVSLSDSNWQLEKHEFLCVFDRVLDELFTLMKQSFERSMYQSDN